MTVERLDPSQRRDLARFIGLERRLVGHEPLLVPELDADVRKRLSGRSAFYEEMEHTLFVSSRKGRPMARIAALINRRYQRAKGEPVGFLGYYAAAPDAEREVVDMLAAGEEWLAARGVTRVIAPYQGAGLLGFGVRVAGFDESPMFGTPWQPPYYADYIEAAGYHPTYRMWDYEIPFESEAYRATTRRALEEARCTVRPMSKRRWKEEVHIFQRLFSEGLRDEWQFHPFTYEELREVYGPLRPLLEEHYVLFAEVDGEPAGLFFALPDWSPLFRSFHGKLGPLQTLRALLGSRRYDRAGAMLIAVMPDFQGRRIGPVLCATFYGQLERRGLGSGLYCGVDDSNAASKHLAEKLGGEGRILYHVYDKRLD